MNTNILKIKKKTEQNLLKTCTLMNPRHFKGQHPSPQKITPHQK